MPLQQTATKWTFKVIQQSIDKLKKKKKPNKTVANKTITKFTIYHLIDNTAQINN